MNAVGSVAAGFSLRFPGRQRRLKPAATVLFLLLPRLYSVLKRHQLAAVAVPAAVVRQAFAAEVAQERLPATAAALRVADDLQVLAQVAILAVAVGLPRPRQLVAGHVRAH